MSMTFADQEAIRGSISLDGMWEFAPAAHGSPSAAPRDSGPDAFPETIRVPGCWQAQGRHCTTGWYRRQVQISTEWRGRLVWLKFAGVSYVTDVWINDQHMLTHEGLLVPFACEIGGALACGELNTIVVRVQTFDYPGIYQSEQLGDSVLGLYGIWMTWGGIFQPVTLETTASVWIDDLFLVPDIEQSRVTARVRLKNVSAAVRVVDLGLFVEPWAGAGGRSQGRKAVHVGPGDTSVELSIAVPDAVFWEPDRPFLYRARVVVSESGQAIDVVSDRFGMRRVEVHGKEIRLNGRPIFLRGCLDDAIYPHQISPTLSEPYVREFIGRCKELGFNFIRHHTHPPVPLFHAIADELGLLQLEEFASFSSIGHPRIDPTQATRRQIVDTWRRLIERDRNHPSLIAFGVNNECWSRHELQIWAPVYRDLYRMGKDLDPTRLIIDNSGGEDRWSVASDIYDKHTYHFPTDKEMARSAHADSRPYLHTRESYVNVDLAEVQKPCLVTEVGGWATFPDFARIRAHHGGAAPWWLSRDPTQNPRMCHEVITRMEEGFALAGLANLYPTIVAHSERYAQMGNKLQVEQMRQTPGIAGYAYCIFMDAYDWTCGLVDPYLVPKSHAAAFARHNQASIVLWPHDRWCFWAGESFTVALSVSHYGDQPIQQGRVRWRLLHAETVLAAGTLESADIDPYQVQDLPPFEVQIPASAPSAKLRLDVSLKDASQALQNGWDVWVFAQPEIAAAGSLIGILDPQRVCAPLLEAFPALAPVSPEQLTQAGVVVTTTLTDEVVRYLDGGGRVLWLQYGQEQSSRPYSNWPIVDYHATLLREHPALAAFPHEGWCDLQFHNLIGSAVVDTGYFPSHRLAPIIEAFHVPFLTHHPEVLPFRRKGFLAETRVSLGRLLTTTFRFEGVGDQPEAQALFGSLVNYLVSASAEPAHGLDADELREWAWGSVHGPVPVDFVPFSF
jgi:hypothetical protein